MRAAIGGYVRTVVAAADEDDVTALRELAAGERDGDLAEYGPFQGDFGEDCRQEYLERAWSTLTMRKLSNEEICDGVTSWASGFHQEVAFHSIPPLVRLAIVVWLAKYALVGPSKPTALPESCKGCAGLATSKIRRSR